MIRREELSYQFIKKEPLCGSCDGMRYYLVRVGESIRAYVYPDRFCFVKMPEEEKVWKDFPDDADSMPLILEWLNGHLQDGLDEGK